MVSEWVALAKGGTDHEKDADPSEDDLCGWKYLQNKQLGKHD
jgi:hypothetical protein